VENVAQRVCSNRRIVDFYQADAGAVVIPAQDCGKARGQVWQKWLIQLILFGRNAEGMD